MMVNIERGRGPANRSRVASCLQRNRQKKSESWKGQSWNEKGYQGGKDANQGGKNTWQKGSGKKGSTGQSGVTVECVEQSKF